MNAICTPAERAVDRLVADVSASLAELVQAAELVAVQENRSKADDEPWPRREDHPAVAVLRADRITAGTITADRIVTGPAYDWLETEFVRS